MKLKDFLDALFFYLSVPKCGACNQRLAREDKVLCPECMKEYREALYHDCSVCAKRLSECFCSIPYLKSHGVRNIVKVYRYFPGTEAPSNHLIYRLKRDHRADVVDFLASELCKSVLQKDINMSELVITNVPRRRSAIKKYGYDHSKMLGKALAKKLKIRFVDTLVSKAKKAQKQNKGEEERINNASFKYRWHAPDLTGKRVLLIDDIITTGASMGACAMLIRGLGAKEIIGAAVAIAYKDEYVPFKWTEY